MIRDAVNEMEETVKRRLKEVGITFTEDEITLLGYAILSTIGIKEEFEK